MKKWWETSVAYQIYPKSFKDSNDDGIGDIQGIISKLDYLHYLGINLIWICPFYKSPMDDNGYDVSDYLEVHEDFGTIEDIKELIQKAKKLEIKIIIDFVMNHTSDEHKWFIEGRKSKESKYHDYYIWALGNNKPPTNWASFFGGSAWEKNQDNEYYMKIFSKKMPDLNWKNKEMRFDIYKIAQKWIDLGIDGFRLDAVSHLGKEEFLDSDLSADLIVSDWSKFSNLPIVHQYLKEFNKEVLQKNNAFAIGELGGDPSIEDVLEYSKNDGNEIDMVFTFSHNWCNNGYDAKSMEEVKTNLKDLKNTFSKFQENHLKTWHPLYWYNHDHPRVVSLYGNEEFHYESATALATSLYCQWGTPFIYQGEEIGMTNYPFQNIQEFQDVWIKTNEHLYEDKEAFLKQNAIKSRDNARTAMQWNDHTNGGFSNTKTNVLVNPNFKTINVESQINEDSVLEYYRKIINLKKNDEVLIYGNYQLIDVENEFIYSYIREFENKKYLIVTNYFKEEASLNLNFEIINCIIANYNFINSLQRKLKPFETFVCEVK